MAPFRIAGTALLLAVLATASAACQGGDGELTDERVQVMIDSLLPAISSASGLEVREPVQFGLQSRADARAFIAEQLDEELGPAELDGLGRSYALFGLIPDTLDLRTLLLELYTEQVVGYYDPLSDRLYLVEGVTPETALPVVAHELVHALQDQHTALDSLVARERGNDRQLAAQAAAEGQATIVMIALQAAATTGGPIDVAGLPDLETVMRPTAEAQNEAFPVFAGAPRIVRETLLFPYVSGAGFVQSLYRSLGGGEPPVPFGDLLPQSTEQVLYPQRAFLETRDEPTEIELARETGPWSVVYSNTLGMLESAILMSEIAGGGPTASAEGWDGDRYALLEGPGGEEALVWYSVWDDEAAADRVTGTLLGAGSGWRAERLERDGRPMIRAIVARDPAALASVRPPGIASLR